MEFTVLVWNLFHGRDYPPDPELRTWRSRLLRFEERSDTHVQVNRDLTREFATLLAATAWDVALLQECPPRFMEPLARACGAEAHRALTSRNSLGPLRGLLARQNPDLMASGEGGSNLTLIRVPGRLGGVAGAAIDGAHPHRLRPLCRQPARDQRPPRAGGRGCAAGRPCRRRVRRCGAADLRRRPQPAPGRGPRDLRAPAGGLRPGGADRAAGDRPPAGPRPRGARATDPVASRAPRAAARGTRPPPLRPRAARSQVCRPGAAGTEIVTADTPGDHPIRRQNPHGREKSVRQIEQKIESRRQSQESLPGQSEE